MDRLEAMSVLVAVADAGSLSAASRRLGTPLATVSRKIAELEEHLQTRLLNRSSRRMTLTDPGRSYVAACKRIIDQVDEAEREATGEYRMPKGRLAVTAPLVFGRRHVLPVATEFLRTYPDIDLRLVLTDQVLDLLEENLDLASGSASCPTAAWSRSGSGRPATSSAPAPVTSRHTNVCGSPTT